MKKYQTLLLILLMLLALGINPLFAQIKIPTGYTVLNESANGKAMDVVSLYFDNDKLADTAVIVTDNTTGKNKLLIYLSATKQVVTMDLGSRYEDFPIYLLPLKVRKNVIEYSYIESGTAHFGHFLKLRYHAEKQKIQVIGYDTEEKISPVEYLKTSANLITGKYIIHRENVDTQKTTVLSGTDKRLKNPIFLGKMSSFQVYHAVYEEIIKHKAQEAIKHAKQYEQP